MIITEIQIENYLGIKFLNLNNLKRVNIIQGDNAVGKSSILDFIKESFVTPRDIDIADLINYDAEKGRGLIKLDNNIEIRRTVSSKSNTRDVIVDGASISSPVAFLKELIGSEIIFNPIEFFNKKDKKERREFLLKAFPIRTDKGWLQKQIGEIDIDIDYELLDYSKNGLEVLNDLASKLYDRRKEINNQATTLEKSIKQEKIEVGEIVDFDKFKNYNFKERMSTLNNMNAEISEHNSDKAQLESLRNKSLGIKNNIQSLRDQISKLGLELAKAEEELVAVNKTGKDLKDIVDSFTMPDIEAIQNEVYEFESYNKNKMKIETIEKREIELKDLLERHKTYDYIHKALKNNIPRKLISESDLPIKNMEIRGDDILIDGVVYEKRSTKEKIEFAVDVAVGSLPDEGAHFICCDNFENLSDTNFKVFIDLASMKMKNGKPVQWFITRVTEGALKVN